MNISLIGLGSMGLPMAKNLINAKYNLYVYDIIPKRMDEVVSLGGIKTVSAREAASKSNYIITMLPESLDTREAILGENGAILDINPRTIVIDMGTGSPIITEEIKSVLAEKDVQMLAAPVSGGVGKAKSGELSVMVSGDKSSYEECKEIFKILGKEVFYVSEQIGVAPTIKLINNMLTGINLVGVCEGMILGMKAGIDPELLLNIINNSSGESYSSRVKVPDFIFKRNFENGFKNRLQYKDMNLASDLAKELKVPTPMGNLALQYYLAAVSSGKEELDSSSIITLLEEIVNVEVRPITN